jgi:hypothetical protein
MAIEYVSTELITKNKAKDVIKYTFKISGAIVDIYEQIVLVTPTMAGKYLLKNTNNRKVSPDRVKMFSWLMQHFYWWPLNSLVFDTQGVLLDGQHRLEAVLKSGVPTHFKVISNVPEDWMTAIDAGRSRKFHDYTKFFNEPFGEKHLAIAKYLHNGCGSMGGRTHKIKSIYENIDLVKMYFEPIDFAIKHTANIRGVTIPVLYAISRAYYTCDQLRLIEFCNVLKTGVVRSDRDAAAITIRDFIRDPMRPSCSSTGGVRETYYKSLTAFDDFSRGVRYSIPKKTVEELEEKYPIPTQL